MYSVVIEHFLYIHYTQVWLFVKLQKCYKTGSSGPMAVFYAFWGLVKGSQFFVLGGGCIVPCMYILGFVGFLVVLEIFCQYLYIRGCGSGDIKSPLRLVFLGIYVVPCMYIFGVAGFLVGLFTLFPMFTFLGLRGWEWIVREIFPLYSHMPHIKVL